MEMTPQKTDLPPLARLAGAFLLASAFFAVAAIVAFGTYGQKTPFGYGFVLAGFLSLAAWFVGRKQADRWQEAAPRDSYGRQRTLLGINAVSTVMLFGVLLIGANYIAGRRHKTFDLTKNRVNSLSDQTVKALDKLPSPVHLTYFYATRQIDPTAQSLLDSYRRSSDKVRVEYVNALREPMRVPQGFTGAPLLVAQLEKEAKTDAKAAAVDPADRQEINVADEQNVTSALLKLIDPKAQTLYFLSGHGEVEPTQIPALQTALEAQNYSLKTVSLLKGGSKVPTDAAALLIAAPQVDLGADEVKTLNAYFANKGRLVLLLSPTRQTLPRLDALVKTLGANVGNGYVFDLQQAYQTPQLPMGLRGDGSRHPLLRGVSADVVFPGAVPLQPLQPNAPGFTPLFETSANSQSMQQSGQSGQKGPFVLAAAVERGSSRAVISSSAALATGEGLNLFGNKSFVLSSVNWTVGNDALVSIPPKEAISNTLQMPEATQRFALLLSVLVLPLVALTIGGVVWWKRR